MKFKKNEVTWLKMVFYVPWCIFKDEDRLRKLISQIAEEVGLDLFGIATAAVESPETPAGLEQLQRMFGANIKWLHVPASLHEECTLYSWDIASTKGVWRPLRFGLSVCAFLFQNSGAAFNLDHFRIFVCFNYSPVCVCVFLLVTPCLLPCKVSGYFWQV